MKTDRERAATVLYVALRAVDSLKMIFTPFLPHLADVHELLGYDGWLAGPLEFRAVTEEDGRSTRSSPATTRAGSGRGSRASCGPASSSASRGRSSASSTRDRRRRAQAWQRPA